MNDLASSGNGKGVLDPLNGMVVGNSLKWQVTVIYDLIVSSSALRGYMVVQVLNFFQEPQLPHFPGTEVNALEGLPNAHWRSNNFHNPVRPLQFVS